MNRIADKTTGNQWTLKPYVQTIIKQHEEMVYYLAKIGEKAGFKVHLATDEYGKRYNKKLLRELIPPIELRLSPDIEEWNLKRIEKIDVVWFKDKRVWYSFDVEKSTNITDSIMRASNIPEQDVKRRIIIPEEYESLMNRVFNEPAINDIIENQKWMVLTFENLIAYYDKVKHLDQIDLDEFNHLARIPREQIRKQSEIADF